MVLLLVLSGCRSSLHAVCLSVKNRVNANKFRRASLTGTSCTHVFMASSVCTDRIHVDVSWWIGCWPQCVTDSHVATTAMGGFRSFVVPSFNPHVVDKATPTYCSCMYDHLHDWLAHHRPGIHKQYHKAWLYSSAFLWAVQPRLGHLTSVEAVSAFRKKGCHAKRRTSPGATLFHR